MKTLYLPPVTGGRWAISRPVAGENVYLIENTYMDNEDDIPIILQILGIENTVENIELYFPLQGECRCPTLAFLELFSTINRVAKINQYEVGV